MPLGRDARVKLQSFIFRRAESSLRPPPTPFAYERCQCAEAAEPDQAEPDENQRPLHSGRRELDAGNLEGRVRLAWRRW
jgi:hypothetical protein